MLKLSIAIVLASFFNGPAWAADAPVVEGFKLVSEQQPLAVIVVPENASERVKTAAGTLQAYLKKSTGATLAVTSDPGELAAIHVGRTLYVDRIAPDIAGLDEDGYVFESPDPKNFIILGGGDWGTEFGVYEFLERYVGVRWLMPGTAGESVPAHTSLVIPREPVRDQPVYNVSRTFSGAKVGSADEIEWVQFNRARFDRLARQHNLNGLFPVSKFGKTNPEFYPILDGARFLPPNDKNVAWQPNFSAPGIVEAAAEQIDAYFQNNPEASSYSLATNDTRSFDESPESLARRTGTINALGYDDVSNDYFPWANAVVEKVLEKYPNRWFGTQAYCETLEAPTNIEKLSDRLVPHITYERMRWSDPKLRAADQALTERWAKVAPTLGWYDYTYGLSYLVPRVWFHLMQEYLQWGAEHNVRSFHGDYIPNWSGEGPKTWLMMKLLWNPNRDVDALLDDWYQHAVGAEAAPKLREYYAIWEKFWTKDILSSPWNRGEGDESGLYLPFQNPAYLLDVPVAYLEESSRLLDEVYSLTSTPDQKARAERIRRMWQFYRASVLSYQAETSAAAAEVDSEDKALELLGRAESVLDLSTQRVALLNTFTAEDGAFRPHFYARPLLIGANWGNSLIWRTLPWVSKSAKVREQVEKLTLSQNPRVKRISELMLKVADGKVSPMLKSASFEQTLRGWQPTVHRTSKGAFSLSKDFAKTGSDSLLADGIRRGLTSQSFPYKAGDYYLTISCYVPADYQSGKVMVRFWVGGKSWKDRGYEKYAMALPSQEVPLRPGEWATLEMPFTMPPDNVVKELNVSVDVTEFPEAGKVYIDDFEIYRIEK